MGWRVRSMVGVELGGGGGVGVGRVGSRDGGGESA